MGVRDLRFLFINQLTFIEEYIMDKDVVVDSGMSGNDVARAELVWTNLPTRRKWNELHTHEKALVCHVIARVVRGEWSQAND